jgi:hypothetical protein
MEQFFADYLERLEILHRGIFKEFQDLPTEAVDWVPGPEMSCWHIPPAHCVTE